LLLAAGVACTLCLWDRIIFRNCDYLNLFS
jgi:hypothetical protein